MPEAAGHNYRKKLHQENGEKRMKETEDGLFECEICEDTFINPVDCANHENRCYWEDTTEEHSPLCRVMKNLYPDTGEAKGSSKGQTKNEMHHNSQLHVWKISKELYL